MNTDCTIHVTTNVFGRGCFWRRSSLGISSKDVWGSVFGIKHTLCFFGILLQLIYKKIKQNENVNNGPVGRTI
jgi:hypothetical protein